MKRFLESNTRPTEGSSAVYAFPSGIAKSIYYYLYGAGDTTIRHSIFLVQKSECSNGFLLLCTLSGEAILRYRNQTCTIAPGCAFFIDCSEKWSMQSEGNRPWHFRWVHFDGQSSLGYFHQYTRRHQFSLILITEH